MRRGRKAKIVATLGPASSSPEVIKALFLAGADVFRMNFSHGSHDDHRARFEIVRDVERRLGRPICVLADLQGPKFRISRFVGGSVRLIDGQKFTLDLDPSLGDANRVLLPHPEIFTALTPGAHLLLDDGRVKLLVLERGSDFAETLVVNGGELSDRKGVNVPNVTLPLSPLTQKDRLDLAFAGELGADWVALSFVQRPDDIDEMRALIGNRARVLAKLEKPDAIEHLDGIVERADALMVARGDLGVECPPETVPILQKRIVRAARTAGKPVIVATQMLDSMVHSPTPTRAEASDVAGAVYDGADAVMLSAETATGAHPVEAVAMMQRIIERVEGDSHYDLIRNASRPSPNGTARDAITMAARQVADTLDVSAVVTFTSSGSTTLRLARERPDAPILCLTPSALVARQMALVWASHSVVSPDVSSVKEMVAVAIDAARNQGFAEPDDQIVIAAGVPFASSGTTNLLRLATVSSAVS